MPLVITYVCSNTFQELPHSSSCLEPESCLQTKSWMKKFSPLFYGFKTHRRFYCIQDHMLQNLPMSIFYFCLRGACRKFILVTMIEWMTCFCVYSHQQRINLYFFCRMPLKDSDFTNNKSGSTGWILCNATWHSSKVKLQSFFLWNQLYKYRMKLNCFRDCFFSVIRTWHNNMHRTYNFVMLNCIKPIKG